MTSHAQGNKNEHVHVVCLKVAGQRWMISSASHLIHV